MEWPSTQSQLPWFRVKILGDSITRFLPYNLDSDWFVPEVVTKPGSTTSRLCQTLRDLFCHDESQSAHVVVIHVGTNDLWKEFFHPFLKQYKNCYR